MYQSRIKFFFRKMKGEESKIHSPEMTEVTIRKKLSNKSNENNKNSNKIMK